MSLKRIRMNIIDDICINSFDHEICSRFINGESLKHETILDVVLELFELNGEFCAALKLMIDYDIIDLSDIRFPPRIGPNEEIDRFYKEKKTINNHTQLLIWIYENSSNCIIHDMIKCIIRNLKLRQSEYIKILKDLSDPQSGSDMIINTKLVEYILEVEPSLINSRQVENIFMRLVKIFSDPRDNIGHYTFFNMFSTYLEKSILNEENVGKVINILIHPIKPKGDNYYVLTSVMKNAFSITIESVIKSPKLSERTVLNTMHKILNYTYSPGNINDYKPEIIPKNILSKMDLSSFMNYICWELSQPHELHIIESKSYVGPITEFYHSTSILRFHYISVKYQKWTPELFKDRQMFMPKKIYGLIPMLLCVTGKDRAIRSSLYDIFDML